MSLPHVYNLRKSSKLYQFLSLFRGFIKDARAWYRSWTKINKLSALRFDQLASLLISWIYLRVCILSNELVSFKHQMLTAEDDPASEHKIPIARISSGKPQSPPRETSPSSWHDQSWESARSCGSNRCRYSLIDPWSQPWGIRVTPGLEYKDADLGDLKGDPKMQSRDIHRLPLRFCYAKSWLSIFRADHRLESRSSDGECKKTFLIMEIEARAIILFRLKTRKNNFSKFFS